MLLAILPLLLGQAGPPPAVVKEFARAYGRRRSDASHDSAIDDAFAMLAKSLVHRPPKTSEQDWLKPFAAAVGAKEDYEDSIDKFPDATFVSLSLGGHKRLTILGPGDIRYNLPARLRNPEEWDITPHRLGPGKYLLTEWSTIAEGMNCPQNFDWLRLSGSRGEVVLRFESMRNLDERQPQFQGDRVSVRYEPQSKVLAISGGMIFLESERVWRWNGLKPALLSDQVLYPGREAVDDAVTAAFTKRHRTPLQVKIRRLMLPQKFEDDNMVMVDEWKESGDTVNLDGVLFRLRATQHGCRVASVKQGRFR